ncbi:MAG: argininosuccinate synthase [Bacteroidetes bacterium]|nr:argininosuccinate synthase [Bacteroidota bacterium]
MPSSSSIESIVVAFSGGLDTSFCVPFLREQHGCDVHTVTVNTGGISDEECDIIAARAKELGSVSHQMIDARDALFQRSIQFLIKGNVLRGDLYPLCVGPDRVVQAQVLVEKARELGVSTVAHGSTGAGNDQIRFDIALAVLGDDLEILTPIRDGNLSRAYTSGWLRDRGYSVSDSTTTYSINTGLWGVTVGGKETLGTSDPLPDEAWPTPSPAQAPDNGVTLSIGFTNGVPTSLDGEHLSPVDLIERLNELGADHGIGRAIHVGDTILGIKGRVGFQAPAAAILIPAHRELEKIVLSRWQQYHKAQLGDFYGMMVHEAQYFDPVMRDIEALLDSSQETVTGQVTISLFKGNVLLEGCTSPFSMFDAKVATYGESNDLWDGRDARGFARILGVQSLLTNRVRAAHSQNPTDK